MRRAVAAPVTAPSPRLMSGWVSSPVRQAIVGTMLLFTLVCQSACFPLPSFLSPVTGAYPSSAGLPRSVQPTPGKPHPYASALALALYHEVWQAIALHYVDPTLNGQRWAQWEHRYDYQIHDEADAEVAIATMLASLNDEYTRFLSTRDYREQTMAIDARLVGVGIEIGMLQGKLVIVSPLPNSPAEKAGLQPKDYIVEVNGQPTAGIPIEVLADRIRGPQGSVVRLTIVRQGTKLPFTLTLQRQAIHVGSVFESPIQHHPELGYIRLNSFISESATREMAEALTHHQTKKGLIFDLRGNYGGLFSNALDVSNLFMRDRLLVKVQGRYAADAVQYYAKPRVQYTGPLVVLIDGGSASASEIVSGAIQDNHRAKLVGSHSFGKGLVQKIIPLSGGAGLNVTIARYLTPNGTDIHHKGVQPDYKVQEPDEGKLVKRPKPATTLDPKLDPALQTAVTVLVQQIKASPAVASRPVKE